MAFRAQEDESILIEVQEHWLTYLAPIIFSFIIFLWFVAATRPSAGSLFFFFLVSLLPVFIQWLKIRCSTYLVSNNRIYVETGILWKKITVIPLTKVNDVHVKQGIIQRIFGAGNIEIRTGNDNPTKLVYVTNAIDLREKISAIIEKKIGNQIHSHFCPETNTVNRKIEL